MRLLTGICVALSILAFLLPRTYAQGSCNNCTCEGQWVVKLEPTDPEGVVVASVEHQGENKYCALVLAGALCLSGLEGIIVSGSTCENLDWGYDFQIRYTVEFKTECLPAFVLGACQRYWRRIENVKESQAKVYECLSDGGEVLCAETRTRTKYFFVRYEVIVTIPDCTCEPVPFPVIPLPREEVV